MTAVSRAYCFNSAAARYAVNRPSVRLPPDTIEDITGGPLAGACAAEHLADIATRSAFLVLGDAGTSPLIAEEPIRLREIFPDGQVVEACVVDLLVARAGRWAAGDSQGPGSGAGYAAEHC